MIPIANIAETVNNAKLYLIEETKALKIELQTSSNDCFVEKYAYISKLIKILSYDISRGYVDTCTETVYKQLIGKLDGFNEPYIIDDSVDFPSNIIAFYVGANAKWGMITGDINDQLDLIDILNNIVVGSNFADIEGNPDDNAALAAKFNAIYESINEETISREEADESYLLQAKAYADLVSTDVLRYAGDWNASLGTYPTNGTGASGSIRRGDCYDIVVAGIIYGNEYEVGDQLRSRVSNPGQVTANWGSGQVNTQQATTTNHGIARMATNIEAVAGSNPLLMSNPATVLNQILNQKKNYIKECYVLAIMEIIFPMEVAGQFTSLSCSSAMSNIQFKIGTGGSYANYTGPVSYSSGSEVFLRWNYVSPTEQRGWIRMKGKDT